MKKYMLLVLFAVFAPLGSLFADVQVPDHRWVSISGTLFLVTSTDGYIYITNSHYNNGNADPIPLSEFRYDPNVGYLFESVSAVSETTGTTISGNGSGFTISIGYSLYNDAQAGINYGSHGALALIPALSGGTLNLQWGRWTRLSLQAKDTGLYVSANCGGNKILTADRTSAGGWEQFRFCVNTGSSVGIASGTLSDGDTVSMLSDSPNWVCGEGGSAVYVIANRTSAGAWEHFTLTKMNGGSSSIGSGDSIALYSTSHSKYWCAENGGGGVVNVNRTSAGGWETFDIQVLAP